MFNVYDLGTKENPIHQSTMNKILDDTNYGGSNMTWEKTVAGSTIHTYIENFLKFHFKHDTTALSPILDLHNIECLKCEDGGIEVRQSKFDCEKFLVELAGKLNNILFPQLMKFDKVYTEYLFQFELYGLWFEGMIDFIGIKNNRVIALDWKTARKISLKKTCQHLIYQLSLTLGKLTKNYDCDVLHKITIEPDAKWREFSAPAGFYFVDLMNLKTEKSKIFVNATRSFNQALFEVTPIISAFAESNQLKLKG